MAKRLQGSALATTLVVAAVFGLGCNAILGIDEGHLVPAGKGGTAGAETGGSGGEGARPRLRARRRL